MRTCLIINLSIFDRNKINFFRTYYKKKFSKVLFTCTYFSDKKIIDNDVIASYHPYWYWYGNAVDVFKNYIHEENIDYYIITNEECLINDSINDETIEDFFDMNSYRIAIPYILQLYGPNGWLWYHTKYSIYPFLYSANEWKKYFMPFEEMLMRAVKYFGYYDVHLSDAFYGIKPGENANEDVVKFKQILTGNQKIYYPLARGLADVVVFSSKDVQKLIKQFEYWSAVGVFCEIAIPTIALSLYEKNQINVLGSYSKKPLIINDRDLEINYKNNLKNILENNPNMAYVRCNIDKLIALSEG